MIHDPVKGTTKYIEQGESPLLKWAEEKTGAIGGAVSRYAKTVRNSALGVIPDTLALAYNIPAHLHNAAAEASQSDLGKKNQEEATSRLEKNPTDPVGLMHERYKLRGDQSQRAPLIPSVKNHFEEKRKGSDVIDPDDQWKHEALSFAMSIAAPGALASKLGERGLHLIERGLKLIGSTKKSDLAVAATVGGATQLAKEKGFSNASSVGIGVGAAAAPFALGKLATAGGRAILGKVGKNNLADNPLLAAIGHSPKNIDLKAVEVAELAGLEYPVTYANKSPALSLVEQVALRTPLVGSKHARNLEDIDRQFSNKVSEIIESSGNRIANTGQDDYFAAGEKLINILKKAKVVAEKERDDLYDAASALLSDKSNIVPRNTKKAIDEVKNSIKTLSAATDEGAILKEIETLKKNIGHEGAHGDFLPPLHVDYLTGTKRSYNDKINWDINASGPKNSLKKIRGGIKKDLENYGKENPEWFAAYKKADEFYGMRLGDEAFSSDYIKAAIKEENPEKLLSRLNEVSKFKNIENSLGSSEQSAKLLGELKREKLEELILGKVIDQKTDQISYTSFAKILENPEQANFIEYLVGEGSYEKLKTLSKYAQAMARRQQRNPNKSGSATSGAVMGVIAGVASGSSIYGAVKNAIKGIVVGGLVSQVITNKRLLNLSVSAAKAAAAGNVKEAARFGELLDKRVLERIGEKKFMEIASLLRLQNEKAE